MGKVNIREKGLRRDDCHYELFSNKCTDQERAPSISVPGRRYQVSKNSSGCIKLGHKRVAIMAFGHTQQLDMELSPPAGCHRSKAHSKGARDFTDQMTRPRPFKLRLPCLCWENYDETADLARFLIIFKQ